MNSIPSHRTQMLAALAESPGTLISSAALTERLGITRQAISKIADGLRLEGIPLTSVPQKGYRLEGEPDPEGFSPAWAEWLLRDLPLGHPLLFFPLVDSTQTPLKDLARQGAPQGAVAVAQRQDAGRGRRGRGWESPIGGGLYFSVLLRPSLLPGQVQLVSFAAALAVQEGLHRLLGLETEIKWPNDVLLEGRKLCGILSEAAVEPDRVHHVVTGMGINVNLTVSQFPEELRPRVATLKDRVGRSVPRASVLASVLEALGERMEALSAPGGDGTLLEDYRRQCATLGRPVRVELDQGSLEGRALSVDPDGALRVRDREGREHRFAAADVFHLRLGTPQERGDRPCA